MTFKSFLLSLKRGEPAGNHRCYKLARLLLVFSHPLLLLGCQHALPPAVSLTQVLTDAKIDLLPFCPKSWTKT